jgi:hypothetical protein
VAEEPQRVKIVVEEVAQTSRPSGDLRAAAEQIWQDAVAALLDAGIDRVRDQAAEAPDITGENASALVREEREFRERLAAVYRPFSVLASEKVHSRLDCGIATKTSDRDLELARADPQTIWIARLSDGSQTVVLKRGTDPDLDSAYATFGKVWSSRVSHYEQVLRYFADPR